MLVQKEFSLVSHKSIGLGSLMVRQLYSTCLYGPRFEPGNGGRGGYLAWISCEYILRLISQTNTEGSPLTSVLYL